VKFPLRTAIFVSFLAVLCLVCVGYAVVAFPSPTIPQLFLFGIFIVVAVLAEIYATRVPAYKWEISSSLAVCLAALFVFGASLGILLVLISSLISETVLRKDKLREGVAVFLIPTTFNISQLVVAITVAGLIIRFSGYETLSLTEMDHYPWAVLGFVSYSLLNWSFVTGVVSLTEKRRFFSALWLSIRQFFVQYVVLCVIALLITVLYSFSPWHTLLGLIPLVLVQVSFRSYLKLRTEARKTFEKMAKLLDERDRYTAVHSNDVAVLAEAIAREMKLSEEEIEKVDIAARVHDIGKVAVPDSVLLKPGELSKDEWTVMKRHPLVSAELIAGLDIYAPVADAVRHEHERWDGTGYPSGLKGDQIPLLARIIAAADIYNALITDRPYRKAYSTEEAHDMICGMRGTALDPAVVDALLHVLGSQGA
jgi:HD-GYP domain-containing protein (c-di-GMP phosphodiesterase class II)